MSGRTYTGAEMAKEYQATLRAQALVADLEDALVDAGAFDELKRLAVVRAALIQRAAVRRPSWVSPLMSPYEYEPDGMYELDDPGPSPRGPRS